MQIKLLFANYGFSAMKMSGYNSGRLIRNIETSFIKMEADI